MCRLKTCVWAYPPTQQGVTARSLINCLSGRQVSACWFSKGSFHSAGSSAGEDFSVHSDKYVQRRLRRCLELNFCIAVPPVPPSLSAGPNGRGVLLQLDPTSSTLPQDRTPLAYSHGQLSFLRSVFDISQELCALSGHTGSRGLIVYMSPCFTNAHYWAIFIYIFFSEQPWFSFVGKSKV